MKFSTANRIAKKLCCQYGILNAPDVIPKPYSRKGKNVILGYYDHEQNVIEINKYAMVLWKVPEIQEIIQHELIHALSYQMYKKGGHGKHFRDLARRLNIGDNIACAVKREQSP